MTARLRGYLYLAGLVVLGYKISGKHDCSIDLARHPTVTAAKHQKTDDDLRERIKSATKRSVNRWVSQAEADVATIIGVSRSVARNAAKAPL